MAQRRNAGKDQVNPGSIILSAEMMLRHIGRTEQQIWLLRRWKKQFRIRLLPTISRAKWRTRRKSLVLRLGRR